MASTKASLSEKAKQLRQKQEDVKKQLKQLIEKQKMEIGAIAFKHGLDKVNEKQLEKYFEQLAKKLSDESSS